MQITEKATRICPMCNEINHIEVGQLGFSCVRCGYNEGPILKKDFISKFKKSKAPKGIGRDLV